MGSFSIGHWIVVLLIVMMVFGTKKLRNMGQDLGSAVKGFKDGMKESTTDTSSAPVVGVKSVEMPIIDVATVEKKV